jgi:hypothetical protein
VLDESLLLFDQALSGRESAARARLTEVLAERARGGEDRQALLDDILKIVLDPDVADDQVGARLRREIGHDRMRAAWEARRERLPRDHGTWRFVPLSWTSSPLRHLSRPLLGKA